MQSTETGEEGERVTREENLLYRRSCPYDAMGDYSLLIEKQQMKSTESEAHHFPAKSKEEPIRQ